MRAGLWMRRICRSPRIWRKGFGDAPEAVAETIRLRGRGGTGGLHHRRCDRQPGPAPLRFRLGGGTDCRGCAGGARTAVSLSADCARTQFALCRPEPGRHHPPPAGLRKSRSRCAFCSRPAGPCARCSAVCAAVSKPVNFMVGIKGKSFSVEELVSGRRAAHQPGDVALSRGHDRFARRGMRGKRQRPVRLPGSQQRQPWS